MSNVKCSILEQIPLLICTRFFQALSITTALYMMAILFQNVKYIKNKAEKFKSSMKIN